MEPGPRIAVQPRLRLLSPVIGRFPATFRGVGRVAYAPGLVPTVFAAFWSVESIVRITRWLAS